MILTRNDSAPGGGIRDLGPDPEERVDMLSHLDVALANQHRSGVGLFELRAVHEVDEILIGVGGEEGQVVVVHHELGGVDLHGAGVAGDGGQSAVVLKEIILRRNAARVMESVSVFML